LPPRHAATDFLQPANEFTALDFADLFKRGLESFHRIPPYVFDVQGASMIYRLGLLFLLSLPSQAADACFTIHGRAHLYGGDGQLRIWHVGTDHDYEPDDPSSRARVEQWLEAGVKESEKAHMASPASMVYLFADFEICPTEPFKKGSVQTAKILQCEEAALRSCGGTEMIYRPVVIRSSLAVQYNYGHAFRSGRRRSSNVNPKLSRACLWLKGAAPCLKPSGILSGELALIDSPSVSPIPSLRF
jgi:hypothetical protein